MPKETLYALSQANMQTLFMRSYFPTIFSFSAFDIHDSLSALQSDGLLVTHQKVPKILKARFQVDFLVPKRLRKATIGHKRFKRLYRAKMILNVTKGCIRLQKAKSYLIGKID